MSDIKNIIFDLGGVILNLNYKATLNSFIELGINNFDDLYNQKKQSELFNNFEKGLISSRTFIYELQKIKNSKDQSIINAWNAMLLDLPKQRLEFIFSLKKDYKIFLLSNTNELHIEYFENQLFKNELKQVNNYFLLSLFLRQYFLKN